MPMGGGGGATNVTQTTVNPTQQAQQPFLQGGWNYASTVRNQGLPDLQPVTYYPGQTYAPQDPQAAAAYQGYINQGYGNLGIANAATTANLGLAGGGQNPAQQLFQGIYNGANAPFAERTGLLDASQRALTATQPQIQGMQDIGQGAYGQAAPYTGGLYDVGRGAYQGVSPYTGGLYGVGQGAYGTVSPYAAGLYGYGNNAYGAVAPQVGGLNSLAGNAYGGVSPYTGGLYDVGANAYGNVSPYAGALGGVGANAQRAVDPMVAGLQGIGQGAYGAVSPYAGQLAGIAGNAQGAMSPYTGGLYDIAGSTLAGTAGAQPWAERAALYGTAGNSLGSNAGLDAMGQSASGAWVGANPYLQQAIKAATDPALQDYQQRIAPGIESGFSGAGRYGSGASMNAALRGASDIERNILNTGATMSSAAYQQDRALQEQAAAQYAQARNNQFQTALSGYNQAGQLGLGMGTLGVNAANTAAQALGTGGQLTAAGINAAINAAQAGGGMINQAGQVGTGALQAGAGARTAAGQLAQGAYGTGGQLVNQAGQVAQGAYGTGGQIYNQAGQLVQGALGTGGQLVNQAGQVGTGALQAGMGGLNTAGQVASGAYGTGGQLYNQAGGVATDAYGRALTGVNQAGQVGIQGMQGSAQAAADAQRLSQSGLTSSADILNRIQLAQLQAAQGVQTGYTNDQRNQLLALSQMPSLLQSSYAPLAAIQQGAQGYQSAQQQAIDAAMRDYYGPVNAGWETINRYMNAIGQPTQGSSSVTTPYFQPSTFQNVLSGGLGAASLYGGLNNATGGALGSGIGSLFGLGGGAAAGTAGALYAGAGGSVLGGATGLFPGAAAAALPAYAAENASWLGPLIAGGSLFSDRRLKTDIERVGALDNGLPVYSFRYIGDAIPRIGLMADEVEKVRPEAVHTMPNGYQAVDYALAVK